MKTKQLNKQSNASKQVIRTCKPCTDGFSLIELIVVIAIMAVLVAVLTPALLAYVERSRAQRDFSTMDEVVNAIMLSMSDSDVYDELLEHNEKGNVSCYIDQDNESKVSAYKTPADATEKYEFTDAARQADETPYYAAGDMRGVTITFKSTTGTSDAKYVLADGTINQFVPNKSVNITTCDALYDRICGIVGEEVELNSQTYRNSEYTIFIKMGTLGGLDATDEDAIQVYGQFNGTNLSATEDGTMKKANGQETTTDIPAPISDDPTMSTQQPEVDPSQLIPEDTTSIDNPTIAFDMELSEDSDNPTEVSESAFNLSGTVAGKDGVKSLTVGGYGEEIDENGSWQTTLRLTNNQVREVVVTATDNAGQVCTKTVYVVYRVYEPFTISTSNRKDIGYDETIASQHLVIPATFEKNGRLYKVVGFNSDAFWYKSNLASVTIPKTVTSISGDPFQGCSNLAAIYVEDGSETYCSVDGVLYAKDMTSIVLYPKGKEGTSYSIQNSVTNIGAYAFYGCKKLSTINIPNNVTNIENFAFYGCEAMQSIDLPNGLINIGEDSFRRTGLTSINIPNSVTTIGGAAFAQSYNITTITIPAKVESIGEAAFWNMNGLQEIIVDDNNQWFCSIDGVLFDKDVTKIIFYPGNMGYDSYTIPNTVITIAEDVFNNRSTGNKLKHLVIPASVVTIEENAFYACDFTTVTFENPDGWKIDGEPVDVSDPATAAALTKEHYRKVWTCGD